MSPFVQTPAPLFLPMGVHVRRQGRPMKYKIMTWVNRDTAPTTLFNQMKCYMLQKTEAWSTETICVFKRLLQLGLNINLYLFIYSRTQLYCMSLKQVYNDPYRDNTP